MKKYFLVLFLFFSCLSSSYEYELSVCAITQNEARFLKEWIEFHRLQGAEHFLLWDHHSTDNTFEVLKPYIDAGIVEYTYVPPDGGFPQGRCYERCISKMCGVTKWLLIIDTDEFITCYHKSLAEFLDEFSSPVVGGVAFNWQMYGTSNVWEIGPNQLMIEKLIMKAPTHHEENKHVKVCVKPEKVQSVINPHVFTYCQGSHTFTTNWEILTNHETVELDISRARINHYWCRDMKFFEEVKIERRKFTCQDSEEKSRWREKTYDVCKDDAMSKYIPELNKNMCRSPPPGKV